MDFNKTKKEIELNGYIKVIFEPSQGRENRFEKRDLPGILSRSVVSIRGWSYPMLPTHSPQDNSFAKPYNISNGVEFYSNFPDKKEVGRLYLSGQFVSEISLYEDYVEMALGKEIPKGKYVDFVSLIYKVTEILFFIKELIEFSNIEGGRLYISYNNTKNRNIEPIFSQMMFSFNNRYLCRINEIESKVSFTKDEIIADSKIISRKVIKELLADFGLEDIVDQTIETHQENLINGRM
mgnify:CR=1 FL=1